jgi:hypothetical protein
MRMGGIYLREGGAVLGGALDLARIGFRLEFDAQPALHPPDNGPGKHPVGQKRHPVDFYEGKVGKGQTTRQTEHHWFRQAQPLMQQQRCHHPAFTVRIMSVLKFTLVVQSGFLLETG